MVPKNSVNIKDVQDASCVQYLRVDHVSYPVGGYNREECLRTVECYDPKEDRWTFIAPMRTPRARFQMAVLMVKLTAHCYRIFTLQ